MPRERLFRSADEINAVEEAVRAAAAPTAEANRALVARAPGEAFALLQALRFEPVGRHPLDDRRLNVVEQLNQTFTILVTLQAARWLLAAQPEGGGARVCLGTTGGLDVASVEENCYAAEAFAATSPHSNRKLAKDMEAVLRKAPHAKHRHVFFYSPGYAAGHHPALEQPGVAVYTVSL